MDRVMGRFREQVIDWWGPAAFEEVERLVPMEMQGFAGLLRGAFRGEFAEATTVRLLVAPWNTDERWEVMVQGRQLGVDGFWTWLADQSLCRIPFVQPTFTSQCQGCGEEPCIHGAALTYHWLLRVTDRPKFLLLLLNRRGKNHHTNINLQPIVRVPVALGTNLDRTRRELMAILESALQAAGVARDNIFGGEDTALDGERE